MAYDLNKFNSGDGGICYPLDPNGDDLLSMAEVSVQRLELDRLGLPENFKIATHIFCIVVIKTDITIARRKWFNLISESKTLTPNVWVFEEKAKGVEIGLLADRYPQMSNVVYIEPVYPYGDVGEQAFVDHAINKWQHSVTYGWLSFILEPLHTAFGMFNNMKVRDYMEICSELFADCSNFACEKLGIIKAFQDEAMANPLEVSINKNFKPKEF
jgi:hypothetical protein